MKRKVLSILGLAVLFLSAVNGLAFAREGEPGDDRRGRSGAQAAPVRGEDRSGSDRGRDALLRHREPEPGDDRVNGVMMRRDGRELEPGDDRGGHGELEPWDDRGGRGELEPWDDHGGRGLEPGDDHGGHGEPEPGDDHGGHGG